MVSFFTGCFTLPHPVLLFVRQGAFFFIIILFVKREEHAVNYRMLSSFFLLFDLFF